VLTELPERIETESWVHPSGSDLAAYREAVQSGNLMAMRRAAWASERSAKLERLREIVAEAEQDCLKVLVFSGFLGVLDLVAREVPGVMGRIDGSVGPQARQHVVEDFSARPEHAVLVSQVEAGGVGINIQAASVVVLAEPQWKPSTEEQAIARAHRMGQTRPVQVHRLLAKDTVDERVREIQEGKRLLFNAYARRSDAKDADRDSVDIGQHRPPALDDDSVSDERRVMLAERHRLGLD
jgi:SNF2 family DNA or RNA helicase